jgi:alkylation response protein AidB-like acyl-CoA dehydrogenase
MSLELRYRPSADQLALASTFNESLEALLKLSRLHVMENESDEIWSSLEALGLFGIGVAEEEGGSGLGATEEALIVMQLGRRLAAPSVLATIGAAHAAARHGAPRVSGVRRTAAAYRRGDRVVMIEDGKAELVLLRAGAETALYASGFPSKPLETRLWLSRLRESTALPDTLAHFDAAGELRLRLIDAAALAGIAEAAVEMSVAYAGLRKQFGRPIGSFQAVKHQCADAAIAARRARDQTSFAAIAVDDGRVDAALQVDCALLVAGNAALENSGKNIQIHGGIGFSAEADPHLLLKRAQLLIALAGGLEAVTDRIAETRVAG